VDVTSALGDVSIKKHYAMGRASWETGVVMPDQRTVLCASDSSSGSIITLFVADKPRDLSSGRIFAMKPKQLNAADGGSWTVEWIPLHTESVNDSYIASFLPSTGWNDSIKFTVRVTQDYPRSTPTPYTRYFSACVESLQAHKRLSALT